MTMFIEAVITECDMTQAKYKQPVTGAYMMSRGASGRVCPVLSVGPEFISERNISLSTYEEVEAWAYSCPGGWLDY